MKGSLMDLITIPIVMLVLSVVLLTCYLSLTSIQSAMNSNIGDMTVMSKGVSAFQNFNTGFVLLLIAMGVASIIYASKIESNPVFMVVGILFMGIGIFLASQLSNIYYTIQATPAMATAAADFSMMGYMMQHLPAFILIFSILLIIVMFAKRGGGYI